MSHGCRLFPGESRLGLGDRGEPTDRGVVPGSILVSTCLTRHEFPHLSQPTLTNPHRQLQLTHGVNQYPEIAFGAAARARQEAVGANRPRETGEFELDPTDIAQIRRADHFFLSTVTESGWPYVQHRGGPAGFVHVPTPTSLAWVDFPGNRHYVSTGNVDRDGRVCLFFIDYPRRARLKVFGHARVLEPDADPDLTDELRRMGEKHYTGRVERISRRPGGSRRQCTKHISPRWDRAHIDGLTELYRRESRAGMRE